MFSKYKNVKFTARVMTQLVLSGPILLSFPFALIVGIGSVISIFQADMNDLIKYFYFIFGMIGLIGLYCSIFINTTAFHYYKLLRLFVTLSLICGLIVSLTILSNIIIPMSIDSDYFLVVYSLVGPTIVAIWNITRIYRKPNKKNSLGPGYSAP